MSKKKYIREGGICQFWDNWAEDGEIDYQKLGQAIFYPESIELKEQERSEGSYIVEKMIDSEEFAHKEKTEEAKPFNRDYKTMTPKIDKIIKKAECIKSYLEKNSKNAGNIDGLIKSLVSYRENVGDIEEERLYTFSMGAHQYHEFIEYNDFPVYTSLEPAWTNGWEWSVPNLIGIRAIEFTKYIANRVLKRGSAYRHLMSLPPIYLNEHIADAVFDVQNFKVDDILLSTELINAGFRPKNNTVKFVCDFD